LYSISQYRRGSRMAVSSYVYTLRHPTKQHECYVGKSINPQKRFIQHLETANNGSTYPVYRWIRKMIREGFTPVLVIESTHRAATHEVSAQLAYDEEFRLQKQLIEQGFTLFNCAGTPKGAPFGEQWRRKNSQRKLGNTYGKGNKGKIVSPESGRKQWETRRALYGSTGSAVNCWDTRRKRYGPTGMKKDQGAVEFPAE
jgi:hypothetical protein